MNQIDFKQLEKWAKNILKDDYDKFDINQESDFKISLAENKTIIREKFKIFLKEIQPTKAEIRTEQEKNNFLIKKEIEKQEQQAQLEFEKVLEKINLTTTTEELEKQYFIPKQYVKMVANGFARGYLLYGEAGLGKSFLVRKSFNEENKSYVILKGHISPLALYEFLYEYRKENIILDDCNVLDNEINLNMFKGCLNEEERIIEYHTKSSKLQMPSKFLFEGTITLLQNNSPKKNENLKAIESRILTYNLAFDYPTKIKIFYEIAKSSYYDLTEQERKNIVNWLKENTSSATENLNLRLLFIVYDFYRFNKERWTELARSYIKTDKAIELIILGMNYKEWCEETGLSRRSYFNYKAVMESQKQSRASIYRALDLLQEGDKPKIRKKKRGEYEINSYASLNEFKQNGK